MGAARIAAGLTLLLGCAHAQKQAAQQQAVAAQPGVFHVVQPGETAYGLSRAYAVPVDAIVRENQLAEARELPVGLRLFLPGGREPDLPRARMETRPPRRAGPSQIPRAGSRPLDPSARGEALAWPTPGVLISGFGTRERDEHDGIDLAAPEGTPICAAASGTVLFSGEQRGYGKLVLLAHEGDLVTVYAHNFENLVTAGQRVERGAQIARVGHTGNATGPHVHFEVRVGTHPRDPLGFLR